MIWLDKQMMVIAKINTTIEMMYLRTLWLEGGREKKEACQYNDDSITQYAI